MGSISAQAKFSAQPTKEEVGMTTALIQYLCNVTLTQSSGTLTETEQVTYSYSGVYVYTWTIKGTTFEKSGGASDSGTKGISGLEKGEPNAIDGSVEVYTMETVEVSQRSAVIENGQVVGYTDWQVVSVDSNKLTASATCTLEKPVYTRPGAFEEYGGTPMSSGAHICEQLTTAWVADWITHMNKICHWYYQDEIDEANNCSPDSVWITKTWYDRCAAAINKFTDHNVQPAVKGGPLVYASRSYITAAIINELLTGNEKSGEVA